MRLIQLLSFPLKHTLVAYGCHKSPKLTISIYRPRCATRSLPDSPQPKLQMANLEQTKSKSNETWRIPSHLSREHIPKRSLPKDKRILRIRGKIKVDWGFLKNTKNPIRENSRFQGVWH